MDYPMLKIENLEIGYHHPICSPISLEASSGELICLIGRNGSGKSTLLNTLASIRKPLSGSIKINNQDIKSISNALLPTKVSFVPSKQEFLSNLKVIDLISLGRSPYTNIFDKKSPNDIAIITEAILEFQLKPLEEKHLYEISDGERQRAMICRSFVQETPIILLDEPTAFLDYYSRHKLLQNLKELAQSKNRCIIFSSHDLDIAFKYCSKVWLINDKSLRTIETEELKKTKELEDIMCFKFSDL
jgi:iron complex transport system ATP-binding protein